MIGTSRMAPDDTDRDLLASIRALYAELREEMRGEWDRDLPLQDLLADRWERAGALGFAPEANIYGSAYVYGDVEVGEGTWVGPMTMLDGIGGLEIGAHCCISPGAHLYSHDTIMRSLRGGEGGAETSPTRVGDCTYIGANAVVLRGVTIGDHCVVGANSVVTEDVPPYSIALGAPARVAGEVVVDASGEVELRRSES